MLSKLVIKWPPLNNSAYCVNFYFKYPSSRSHSSTQRATRGFPLLSSTRLWVTVRCLATAEETTAPKCLMTVSIKYVSAGYRVVSFRRLVLEHTWTERQSAGVREKMQHRGQEALQTHFAFSLLFIFDQDQERKRGCICAGPNMSGELIHSFTLYDTKFTFFLPFTPIFGPQAYKNSF